MGKSHFSFRLVVAFMIVAIGIVFAACNCSQEVYSPPISEAVTTEASPLEMTTSEQTEATTESTEQATTATEAVTTTSSTTTATHTEETTTTASTAAKTTTTTSMKTTTTAKPSTTTKHTTTTTTTTKAPTTTTTTTTTATTTTTKKSSAVWGSASEMKSDCVAIGQSLGYVYDSSLNKSNGHWITPTFSGAFTSSSSLKAKVRDALETYQTVGYSYCNFIFESNGEGEYYIYIIVG